MEFDFEKMSEWPSLSQIDSSKDNQGDRISALTRCTQCKETLYDSITLHCLHFLCKGCFERKVGEQNDESCTNTSEILINCPACFCCTSFKKQTYLETKNRVPQVMKTLLDFKFGIDFSLCVSCKNQGRNTKASFWCFDCVDNFCKECLNFHLSIPLLEKHKTYSFNEVKKDNRIISKARELCDDHNLCFTTLCMEKEGVCCDRCLSSDHIDTCKGEHSKIQEDVVVILANHKLSKLRESLRITLHELDDKDKELSDIEMKTEIFFTKEKNNAIEKSRTLKEKLVDSTGKFLAESYQMIHNKLQQKESRIDKLKKAKSGLENEMDLALREKSDDVLHSESEKIKQVLVSAKTVLDDGGKNCINSLSICFEATLNALCNLDTFGQISESRSLHIQDTSMCSTSSSSDSSENSLSALTLKKHWVSEANLSSVHSKGSNNSSTWNTFDFDEDYFEMNRTIDIEDGMSHVTGCDWKSENEIVIIDQKVNDTPELCVFNIRNVKVKCRISLDQKPYDISVLPYNECVITFPREMEIRVYNLSDYSVQREIEVGMNCYGVCYCSHQQGGTIIVAGEDNIIIYDDNFNEIRRLTVWGEDIRYVSAYSNNLIFYSDIKASIVYSVIGNGDNRFEYTGDDELQGPAGLILDESKNVYVCEKGADCIHVLSKSGDFIRTIDVGNCPTAISLSRNKRKICIIRGGRRLNNVADIYISR